MFLEYFIVLCSHKFLGIRKKDPMYLKKVFNICLLNSIKNIYLEPVSDEDSN